MTTETTTYRVFVSTDLGGDPDDIQSLIHLLHYSDVLKLEGVISSPGPGSVNRVEKIREWILRTDLDFLRAQGYAQLMAEVDVLACTGQGATEPGAPGPGKATEGSKLLVRRAKADDPLGKDRPLWVLVWGSMTDVAQALFDAPDIAPRIRLYSIGSSNTKADPAAREYVYEGMQAKWPDLWWIENGVMPLRSRDTFRGYYSGGDQSGEWGAEAFIPANIRGRGTTRGGRFGEKLGDAMPVAGKSILKEGDTPTFLYLLSPVEGGVGDVDDPTQESWGGRFFRPEPERFPNYYTDLDASADVCQATISKWRVDFLRAWKERWGRYA